MAANRTPPVIPEIAKAYQNDPRTALALAAMKAGQSTAPVAQGGYGYMDGIARVLQGGLGGYFNKQQEAKYGADEDAKVAAMHAQGLTGLNGAAPDPTLPQPNAAPQSVAVTPQMQQAAAALGSPPPAPPAGPGMGGPPPIPTAPIPPPAPPQAMGGGPQGQLPFAPGSVPPPATAVNRPVRGAAAIAPPVPQAIPDAPAPMVKPVAPVAVGPTQSGTLNSAYKLMANGDRYDYGRAQDLLTSGLSDQDKLNEDAAKRKQEIQDAVYGADRNQYDQSESQARGAQYADRTAAQTRNFTAEQAYTGHVYKSGEDQAANDFTGRQNDLNRANALTIARLKEAGDNARANSANEPLDTGTISDMAQQALTGDPSVMQGLGWGKSGLATKMAIKKEMYRQGRAAGISPTKLADINAQYFGEKAEARTAGTRVGNTDVATGEVPGLAQAALAAHAALPKTNLVPFNQALQMAQRGTSSPELARAATAGQALINAYARSFGTGQPSVHAQQEASKLVQNAWGTPAYEATINQIQQNIQLERAGATAALHNIGGGNTPPPANVPQRKPGESVSQYLARTGG